MDFFFSKKLVLFFLTIFLLFSNLLMASGTVYLVIGSDTAIWEGMSTGRFQCTYRLDLYTDPARNGYAVMDPEFRSKHVDSFGQPLKLTWWMMAGNIFRYATNTNVPIPNIMTLYLMKKYHGDAIQQYGDELSLHYHTFHWSDYDGDGRYYWNQSLTFMECYDDFNYTLAQFLLEEEVFPVSFRSGWHYMDNDWQNYLDELLPFSMHNDYPHKRTDTTEPLDNTYDWSLAPREFIPYRPSPENYQIPGDGPGWNVRSAHLYTTRRLDLLDTLFNHASKGIDQVACIWGHLPEVDFLENIAKIDSVAHLMESRYPGVKFRYCSAIEAMQLWMGTDDDQAPVLDVEEIVQGNELYFQIYTNEEIFQNNPFVAAKDIYEDYFLVPCTRVSENSWQTTRGIARDNLAKIGVAVCDTLGNQSIKILRYLPDDIFIDNNDHHYVELEGNWQSTSNAAWDMDARIAQVGSNDSARVQWNLPITQSAMYNISIQVPEISNPVENITFILNKGIIGIDTLHRELPLDAREWVYLHTAYLQASEEITLEMVGRTKAQTGKTMVTDVLKLSAMVREIDLYIADERINLDEVSKRDTSLFAIKVHNRGYMQLTISGTESVNGFCSSPEPFPIQIEPMSSRDVMFYFYAEETGLSNDTLVIQSNDPRRSTVRLPLNVFVQNYFQVVDNEESDHYYEFGTWHYSNAQAYGPSSRYAWLNSNPLAFARFEFNLKESGHYELYQIVPSTENATDHAAYIIAIDGNRIDSSIVNQNSGSGNWVLLGSYDLPADVPIQITVRDVGKSTVGQVLRADAVRLLWIGESTSLADPSQTAMADAYELYQNYPNPFNPVTQITFHLPQASEVNLVVYDLNGRMVRSLLQGPKPAGLHQIEWDGLNNNGSETASGVYVYLLKTERGLLSRKMIKLR